MEYFSTRNTLQTFLREPSFKKYCIEALKRLPYAVSKALTYGNNSLMLYILAVYDFIFQRFSLSRNLEVVDFYRSRIANYPNPQYIEMPLSEFESIYNRGTSTLVGSALKVSVQTNEMKKLSINSLVRKSTCVIAGFSSPNLPITYLFYKVVFVADVDIYKKSVRFWVHENHRLKSFFNVAISLVVGALFGAAVMPILGLKYLQLRLRRQFGCHDE